MRKYGTILMVLIWTTEFLRAQSFFVDVSDSLNLHHMYTTSIEKFGSGLTFFDFNQDGFDDLSLSSGHGDSLRFYLNNGSSFTDLQGFGIDELEESKQILWVDYDNDGDYDLFITNFEGQSRLWRNQGSLSFENVTEQAGIVMADMPTFGASWGDYDRDGLLDLYITNYSSPEFLFNHPWPKRNYLYHNKGDGTFEEVAAEQGTILEDNHYFTASFLDLNNSCWPDLYVIQDLASNLGQTGNTLFWNNYGSYVDATNTMDLEEVRFNAMCIAAGDPDNDGDLDIYISNTAGGGGKFHVNQGDSTFTEGATDWGIKYNDTGAGWGAQFFDFDNDGLEDFGIVGAKPLKDTPRVVNKVYRNIGIDTFRLLDNSEIDLSDSTRSFAIAYADYNNDGKLDFVISGSDTDSIRLYKNVLPDTNHYVMFDFQGTVSNRDGIGVWARAYTNGEGQVRYTTCGIGFLSQNTHNVHFGLGTYSTIDSLLVTWPSGWVDRYYNIEADSNYEIIEGETADFRFSVYATDSLEFCTEDNITLVSPEYDSYLWNDDSTNDSLQVHKTGVYSCSVVNSIGQRGLSYPVFAYKLSSSECILSVDSDFRSLVNIYPNPSNTGLYSVEGLYENVKVLNILGLPCGSWADGQVDLSEEPAGTYILVIYDTQGRSQSYRLIRN